MQLTKDGKKLEYITHFKYFSYLNCLLLMFLFISLQKHFMLSDEIKIYILLQQTEVTPLLMILVFIFELASKISTPFLPLPSP